MSTDPKKVALILMKKFNFTIHIIDSSTSKILLEDRLYNAGCDDALVCSTNNNVYLEFSRESETLELAIESAVKSINDANAEHIHIYVDNILYPF